MFGDLLVLFRLADDPATPLKVAGLLWYGIAQSVEAVVATEVLARVGTITVRFAETVLCPEDPSAQIGTTEIWRFVDINEVVFGGAVTTGVGIN